MGIEIGAGVEMLIYSLLIMMLIMILLIKISAFGGGHCAGYIQLRTWTCHPPFLSLLLQGRL
jgi:hypothetical protein